MTSATYWLPTDALRSARAAGPFVAAIDAWADSWFTSKAWVAGNHFSSAGASGWSVLRQVGGIDIMARPKAVVDLAFALLGQKSRQSLTETDLRLLRRLAGRAIDDLSQRLEAVFPGGSGRIGTSARKRWQLDIGPAADPILAIMLDESLLATVARTAFSPCRAPTPLFAASTAVEDIIVPMSGRIGAARLAIEQIDAIEVGDLLVLDETADALVRLNIAGRASDLRFSIGETDGRLTLTMQE